MDGTCKIYLERVNEQARNHKQETAVSEKANVECGGNDAAFPGIV